MHITYMKRNQENGKKTEKLLISKNQNLASASAFLPRHDVRAFQRLNSISFGEGEDISCILHYTLLFIG